jgi:hypothetical protein
MPMNWSCAGADNLVYWKTLLSAALSNDEDAVLSVHVQTLQLLGN